MFAGDDNPTYFNKDSSPMWFIRDREFNGGILWCPATSDGVISFNNKMLQMRTSECVRGLLKYLMGLPDCKSLTY